MITAIMIVIALYCLFLGLIGDDYWYPSPQWDLVVVGLSTLGMAGYLYWMGIPL